MLAIDLEIQGEHVVYQPEAEQPERTQIYDSSNPFTHHHAVDAKATGKNQHDPDQIVIVGSWREVVVGLVIHCRN